VLHRDPDGFKLVAYTADGLLPACGLQRLANPLRKRHVPRSRNPLDCPVFRIPEKNLQSLSHAVSVVD
jgi:hypothetical protein